jgi:hypothetical protein
MRVYADPTPGFFCKPRIARHEVAAEASLRPASGNGSSRRAQTSAIDRHRCRVGIALTDKSPALSSDSASRPLTAALRANHAVPAFAIPWQFFTLLDAIDFAAYGMRATIESMRFQARAKTVGGAVDILVLKPAVTEWVAKKQLRRTTRAVARTPATTPPTAQADS